MQWNPWHGCRKYSEGCLHCYVYRTDALYGRDSSRVVQTAEFDKPLRKKRDGEFLLAGDEPVFTCFSSDFFLEEADVWAAGGVADDPRAAGAFVFHRHQAHSAVFGGTARRLGRRLRKRDALLHRREPPPRCRAAAALPFAADSSQADHLRAAARAYQPVALSRPAD